MSSHSHTVVDEHDELIDATIEKMNDVEAFNGFKAPKQIHSGRTVKTVRMAGREVVIEHVEDADHQWFSASLADIPAPDAEHLLGTALPMRSMFFYQKANGSSKAEAHKEAMAWADKAAHAYAIADAALSSLQATDMTCGFDQGWIWQDVAAWCLDNDKTGRVTADVTERMQNEEQSHGPAGGRFEGGGKEIEVNLDLLLGPAFTGGRWIAVYEAEAA